MASGGSGLRITDVEYSNTPDTTAKVFINDAGKLRQTDLDTMVKYSSIYQEVVNAGTEATATVQSTVDAGHAKLQEDIAAVDDLRTAVSEMDNRLDNLSSDAADITLTTISGMSATNVEAAIKELNTNYQACFQSVSDGKAAVATALTKQGVSTSATAAYETMATRISTVANNKYSAGIRFADGRTNTHSKSYIDGHEAGYNTGYNAGYNNGVIAADGRANANSTNYKTGYNAGYSAGVTAGGAGKRYVAVGTGSATPGSNTIKEYSVYTGLSSVEGFSVTSHSNDMSIIGLTAKDGYIYFRCWGRYGGTYGYSWVAYS